MSNLKRLPLRLPIHTLILPIAAALAFSVPALAQDGADAPLATVNGDPITEMDMQFAREASAVDFSGVPELQIRAYLLNELVLVKAMAQAAREAGLTESEIFQRRLQYLEERALGRAFYANNIEDTVTDAEVQATYDEWVSGFEPREQIRARHILLNSEEDAQAVIEEINAGRSFEEVAAEKSIGPSGPSGGELGWFFRAEDVRGENDVAMVPPFEEAAFALEAGELSGPVQTDFGWHVIEVEERRETEPAPLEQVADQLRQQLVINRSQEVLTALHEDAEIVISDPELAAAAEQQTGN